ncbi:MAG: hypothetical protein PHE68_06150 [Candidatus Peribacteraceae bacterium]|jgi:hypothetical protein|nr:hypothetical protein [Candidatus Peribacteraceae bacterium]MDD5074963.1 hypothetical protein [Candidatus Peribacteraceae bacterium]
MSTESRACDDGDHPIVAAAEGLLQERVGLGGGYERDFDPERNRQALEKILPQFDLQDVHSAIMRLMVQGRLSPSIGGSLHNHPAFDEINRRLFHQC